jgi:hypothetical protein
MLHFRDPAAAARSPLLALATGVFALAACADEPTSLNTSTGAAAASGSGGASASGAAAGAGGDLGDARVLFFGAEAETVDVASDNSANPSFVALGDARMFTLPVGRDCDSGDTRCVTFTRSGEESATRLRADTDVLLVHVFAGDDDLDGDVTIDAADVPSPGESNAGLHYRSLAGFVEYGVLDEVGAFMPFKSGFNQVDPEARVASYDGGSGIVRVDLPEPLAGGGRYAMVVGEEPGGHWVAYCSLDGDEEACSSFSSDVAE